MLTIIEKYKKVDREQLVKDLNEIKDYVVSQSDDENDFKHFKKMELLGRLSTFFGYITSWIFPNPISIYLLSQGSVARWSIVTHHIMHKTFDQSTADIPNNYKSKYFASGTRRYLDWFDWIYPMAWDYEHNIMHHYHLGERLDPDQVEYNRLKFPDFVPFCIRYIFLIIFGMFWKIVYYVPNTYKVYLEHKKTGENTWSLRSGSPFAAFNKSLFINCIFPYGIFKFILIPLMFLPLGKIFVINVLINSIFAELLANFHSFLIIAPNHTGDDIMSFETKADSLGEFYLRQIIGSANFKTGSDLNDFFHGWLNYQIEHHIWPNMTPRRYQIAQPLVKKMCEKHDIPYVQESVFIRFYKFLEIMSYKKSMIK